MALSRLDLVLAVAVASVLLWTEHAHRIVIEGAASDAVPSAASICPDTDAAPYDAACVKFIDGGKLPIHKRRLNIAAYAAGATAYGDRQARLHTAACPPNNENRPYSPACLRYLSGAYWQPGGLQDANWK